MNAVEYLSRAESMDITDEVMASMDCFTDWLGAECFDKANVSSERICRMPALFDVRLAQADVVRKPFLIAIQRRNLDRIANNDEPYAESCRQAIAGVIVFLESDATGFAAHAGRWSVAEAARESAQSAYMAKWSASKWSAAESARAAVSSAEWLALESDHPAATKAWATARLACVKAVDEASKLIEHEPDQRPSVGAETARSAAQDEELRAQRDILLWLIRGAGK